MKKVISLEIQTAVGAKTGIGWYTYNLTKELCKNNKNKYIGEVFNLRRRNLSEMKIPNLLIKENVFLLYRLVKELCRYISYNFLMNSHSDIYHFFNFFIPNKINGKVIVTIHDLVYKKYPETVNFDIEKFSTEVEYSIKHSNLIIVVSEATKKDILENFNISQNKIEIVSPGIYLEDYNKIYLKEQIDTVKNKYGLSSNFILYLGTIEPRKNITNIILAFEKYKMISNDKNLKLVIAGRKGWKYEKIFETYKNSKVKKDIKFINYIDEEDKIILYKLAKLFVFPSLYEGFGMPVLEAMAAGIPVITSNVSSLPEVAGEGAILVNPHSVEEIEEGINKIINGDKIFVEELITQGKEQAKKYTWEKSAKKLEKIYEKL